MPFAYWLRLASASLLICLLQSHPRVTWRRPFPQSSPTSPRAGQAMELYKSGQKLAAQGNMEEARAAFLRAAEMSRTLNDEVTLGKLEAAIGASYAMEFRNREAISWLLRARDRAESQKDWSTATVACSNLAAVYSQIGHRRLALEAARRIRPEYAPAQALVRVAILALRQNESAEAQLWLQKALDRADADASLAARADVLSIFGYHLLDMGRLSAAEPLLIESFRLRKLLGSPQLGVSYRNLALLDLAQGHPQRALRYLDQAWHWSLRPPYSVSYWDILYRKAVALRALGRLNEALEHLDRALFFANQYRAETLQSDSLLTAVDVTLQRIVNEALATGRELLSHPAALKGEMTRARRQDLAFRLFLICEQGRAASLRRQLFRERAYAPAYWAALSRLRQLEVRYLRGEVDREDVDAARARLEELEGYQAIDLASFSRKSSEKSEGEIPLQYFQRVIPENSALLSFHSGEQGSILWALTKTSFEYHLLPPRRLLRERLSQFRDAIHGNQTRPDLGFWLYAQLFGALSSSVRDKNSWVLSVDEEFFHVPLSALSAAPSGRPYLAEEHSLRFIPSALLLLGHHQEQLSGRLLAISDPVYNTADPRWPGRSSQGQNGWRRWFAFISSAAEADSVQMPRLAMSRAEVQLAEQRWEGRGPVEALTGAAISREAVLAVLVKRPAVAHFAVHFIPQDGEDGEILTALGLNANRQLEVLTNADISSRRLPVGLVVLSGCSSGTGKALPGAGLIGLTRSWLIAGAESVMATLWPIPDDPGTLFRFFYQELAAAPTATASAAAQALWRAQKLVIQSSSPASAPRYWAAFYITARN